MSSPVPSFFSVPSIRDISRSWLLFLSEALAAEDIPLVIESGGTLSEGDALSTLKPPAGYVLLAPASDWQILADSLEAQFSIQVITSQLPDNPLSAYERNLAIQIALSHILFGPERLLSGFSTGADNLLFSIPSYSFKEDASTSTLMDSFGLTYSASRAGWEALSPGSAERCVWRLNLVLSSTR